jgi:3-dehydroquinate synthase
MTEIVPVAVGDRSYDIHIGAGLMGQSGEQIARCFPGRQVRIVCDAAIAGSHLQSLKKSLARAGIPFGDPVILPSGETSKSLERYGMVCEELLASRIERSTILIALGGGVTGDLTGFAAATLLRGLDFVQVPTTLLSQVDSSVGGKTGINARAGKNLIGAFHQPRLVLVDIDTLDTLSHRELLCGYAEMLKHGLILDAGYFEWLEHTSPAMLAGDKAARIQAIKRSCEIKAGVVARDEHEHGERALLNFGHTFGHALEALTGYGDALRHGEAVALGMLLALELSVRMGLCPPPDRDRIMAHYHATGLPTLLKREWNIDPAGMMDAMAHDKKARSGRIGYILLRAIGDAFQSRDVKPELIHASLAAFTSAAI